MTARPAPQTKSQAIPETDPELGPLSRDGFLGGRLRLLQPVRGYRAATDPVLLAAFTPAGPGERVLDLGCGAGTASLCLATRVAGLELHGIELQPAYARLARRNAAENGIAFTIHDGDIARPPAALRALAFDQVLTNPPFYEADGATAPADRGRDQAHREQLRLGSWIAAGLRRLRPGGRLTLIHRAERLAAILAALDGPAGGIEVLPIVPRAGRPAGRVLVRARKAIRAPLILHSPLTVHRGTSHSRDASDYTEFVEKLLRDAADLIPNSTAG